MRQKTIFPVTLEFELHGEWVSLVHYWGDYLGGIELTHWSTLPTPEAAAQALIREPLATMSTLQEAFSNKLLQKQAIKVRFAARIRHALNLWWRPSRLAATSCAPVAAARNTSSVVCSDQQNR